MFKKLIIAALVYTLSPVLYAAPCSFNPQAECTMVRDILNDRTSSGLKYYASTNYDHRKSGEINVYNTGYVKPYQDQSGIPGQLQLLAKKINSGYWLSGEIETRHDLDKPPYNSPVRSVPWTTKEIDHGYLEVTVKMARCEESADGRCQNRTNPKNHHAGLWPAIWLKPTKDANWPTNGEIDIMEAYPKNRLDFKTTTSALHFNGRDPRCNGGDCKGPGFRLAYATTDMEVYRNDHTWGFEWQKDPASNNKGMIITGYVDNKKVWGPLRTDTLPADGPNALRRGFNEPTGGYYLIVNLAMGGPYAGPVNSQVEAARMIVRSIKAYRVGGGSSGGSCLPPANIRSTWTPDRKSITLSWDRPSGSAEISEYQVKNWVNETLWTGTATTFTEDTLPGRTGRFTYYLYSACSGKLSDPIRHEVYIR